MTRPRRTATRAWLVACLALTLIGLANSLHASGR